MKKLLTLLILLFALTSFNSCAVVNALLGINDTCDYTGCERPCADDCNYCDFHCDSHPIPPDFNRKIDKSINKQLEPYRGAQKSGLNY